MSTKDLLAQMDKHNSQHYMRSPVCFGLGKGVYIKDTEDKVYFDAASGYGSVGLGHNHPRICSLLRDLNTLDDDGWGIVNVVPNVHSTPPLGALLEHMCRKVFGYDRALVTNGGVEAIEAAIKLMRKWGYVKKGIAKNRARIVVCEGNFHGRTTTVVGFSSEPAYRDNFGPYAEDAFVTIPFGDCDALERVLLEDSRSGHPTIAGFLVEPIQGEGGVRIPPRNYLHISAHLCKKYNVIFCADEIQTGLGRTGKLLASWHEHVKPDLVVLGKTLGGGKHPVAAVLGNNAYMVFRPGDHGSTYGGNTTGMSIALEALSIIKDEKLCQRAAAMGILLLNLLSKELSCGAIPQLVKIVRGRGLMIGIELHDTLDAHMITSALLEGGVMTKDAHNVIRITPALVISEQEVRHLAQRVGSVFAQLSMPLLSK